MVVDLVPGPASAFQYSPANLTASGGLLYFTPSPTFGVPNTLWRSDGTAAGTYRLRPGPPPIGQPPALTNVGSLTDVNGTLFFSGYTSLYGQELWRSDGTTPGTNMVKDIIPGFDPNGFPRGSGPSNLVNVNGICYFAASSSVSGPLVTNRELWRSNGTAPGTYMVKDINPGLASSNPENLVNVNGTLFFTANDGVHGEELWKSDGTPNGTNLVKDIDPGRFSGTDSKSQLTNVNGTLYFVADDGAHGRELWKSNGTSVGTVLVMNIYPGATGGVPNSSNPQYLTAVGATLFFSANDGAHGVELWSSNNVNAPGQSGGSMGEPSPADVSDPLSGVPVQNPGDADSAAPLTGSDPVSSVPPLPPETALPDAVFASPIEDEAATVSPASSPQSLDLVASWSGDQGLPADPLGLEAIRSAS